MNSAREATVGAALVVLIAVTVTSFHWSATLTVGSSTSLKTGRGCAAKCNAATVKANAAMHGTNLGLINWEPLLECSFLVFGILRDGRELGQ
jgi:hypothetical protein